MLQFLPLCGCHPLRYTADIGGQASSQSRSRLERRRFNGLNSAAPSTCKAFSIELRELTALGYPGGDSILPNQPRRDQMCVRHPPVAKPGNSVITPSTNSDRPLHIIRVVRCEPNRRPANIDRLSDALVGNQGK